MTTTDHSDIPFFDLKDEAYRQDPIPVVNAWRDRHWIAQSARGFEIFGYEQCSRLMPNLNFFPGIAEILAQMGISSSKISPFKNGRNLLMTEGKEHHSLRQALMPWFSPRTINSLRQQTKELIEEIVDDVTPKGHCDFQHDIAIRIPPLVFCTMVGADTAQAPHLYALSSSLSKAFNQNPDDLPEINAAGKALGLFVRELIAEKKSNPGDDLTSFMLTAAEEGKLSEADVGSLAFELLGASSDNTSTSASLMIWNFAKNPDQWHRVVQDPKLIESAVEETFRISPRVTVLFKVNEMAQEVDGVTIPAKSHIYFNIIAANRDPSVFKNPNQFDVGRKMVKPQLVFGQGRHHCLGANLARMELSELLGVLIKKWKAPKLNGAPKFLYTDDMEVLAMPIAFEPT